MEIYGIWYKTEQGCLLKYQEGATPREAQKEFLKNNPNKEIFKCEHIGKKININCKVIKLEELKKIKE